MSRRDHGRRVDARRVVAALAATCAISVGGIAWASSRLGEYSVAAMGQVDHGQPGGHHDGTNHVTAATPRSVTSLVADPDRPADVSFTLIARSAQIAIPGGQTIDGFTVNGSSPGPTLRVRQGQLVEVTLVNESVAAGATLHWHGVDVPNAADGVAGITQDTVAMGARHVYRFVAEDPGTYWYHSHQLSHDQVERGLLGALVVEPAHPAGGTVEALALLHLYAGQHTLNGRAADERVTAAPGQRVRVRVINTDQGTAAVWSDSAFRVVAIDGRDVHGPTDVTRSKVLVPAGGRVDVEVLAPASGAATAVRIGGARSVVIGDPAAPVPTPAPQPDATLDLLAYGTPAALGFDPAHPDRSFDYVIGRRIGLLDGKPGMFWTINGHLYPDVPMFHVSEGDVVRMRIVNDSAEVHPMHLHGHHVVVLSRNGVAAQGSPWLADSIDVQPGETYEIAFVADNPGIWSDHCHTLQHAVDGLVTHLMYDGVTTPFTINGAMRNSPE